MRSKNGEIKKRENQGIGDVLSKVAPEIKIAFLYGSIPAGTDTGRSDIDLMVIGGISFRELTSVLKEAESILNKELNPTLFSVSEFRRILKSDDHLIKTIMNSAKIFIIETADNLAGLFK